MVINANTKTIKDDNCYKIEKEQNDGYRFDIFYSNLQNFELNIDSPNILLISNRHDMRSIIRKFRYNSIIDIDSEEIDDPVNKFIMTSCESLIMRDLLFNGIHYNIDGLIYQVNNGRVNPSIRSNIDYIIIDPQCQNIQYIYDIYANILPSINFFGGLLNKLSNNNELLVINNKEIVNNVYNLFYKINDM